MKSRISADELCRNACRLVVLSAFLAGTCFAGSVKTVTSPEADFSRYKTYNWLPTKLLTKTGIVENDKEFDAIVRDVVNRHLAAKGLKEVPSGGDLEVATLAMAESIPQVEGYYFPGAVPADWGVNGVTIGRYNREGTLIVNLIDSLTKKSAWAGMAKESIENKAGSGKKKIAPAAAAIFKKYPVKK